MIIIDIITSIPFLLINCIDYIEVVSVGVVLLAFGFLSSIVSHRNI